MYRNPVPVFPMFGSDENDGEEDDDDGTDDISSGRIESRSARTTRANVQNGHSPAHFVKLPSKSKSKPKLKPKSKSKLKSKVSDKEKSESKESEKESPAPITTEQAKQSDETQSVGKENKNKVRWITPPLKKKQRRDNDNDDEEKNTDHEMTDADTGNHELAFVVRVDPASPPSSKQQSPLLLPPPDTVINTESVTTDAKITSNTPIIKEVVVTEAATATSTVRETQKINKRIEVAFEKAKIQTRASEWTCQMDASGRLQWMQHPATDMTMSWRTLERELRLCNVLDHIAQIEWSAATITVRMKKSAGSADGKESAMTQSILSDEARDFVPVALLPRFVRYQAAKCGATDGQDQLMVVQVAYAMYAHLNVSPDESRWVEPTSFYDDAVTAQSSDNVSSENKTRQPEMYQLTCRPRTTFNLADLRAISASSPLAVQEIITSTVGGCLQVQVRCRGRCPIHRDPTTLEMSVSQSLYRRACKRVREEEEL